MGGLGSDIWEEGKLRDLRSPLRLLRWPRSRGCNVPELPVESALDQVHSQAGACEAPAKGRVRWSRARWASHGWILKAFSNPVGTIAPLRAQGTPASSCLHFLPQKHLSPGQSILLLPMRLRACSRPHCVGQGGLVHQKLF